MQIVFGLNHLQTKLSGAYLFESWIQRIGSATISHFFFFAGASALCWAMWLNRNNNNFEKSRMHSYQIIFRDTLGQVPDAFAKGECTNTN